MDRKRLKSNAKFVLKKQYVMLFIVSLIIALIGGNTGSGGSGHRSSLNYSREHAYEIQDSVDEFRDSVNFGMRDGANGLRGLAERYGHGNLGDGADYIQNLFEGLPIGKVAALVLGAGLAIFALIIGLAAVAFVILVSFPIEVGGTRIFLETADGATPAKLGKLAFAFTSGHYFSIVKTGVLVGLYTFLWSLLFVIPGIVKGYAYSFVPYILADNPTLSSSEAIDLSKRMTYGHKMDLFILDLSFIGWYLLGALAFGIGVFLVHPYRNATWAQAYLSVREGFVTTPAEEVFDARGTSGTTEGSNDNYSMR